MLAGLDGCRGLEQVAKSEAAVLVEPREDGAGFFGTLLGNPGAHGLCFGLRHIGARGCIGSMPGKHRAHVAYVEELARREGRLVFGHAAAYT